MISVCIPSSGSSSSSSANVCRSLSCEAIPSQVETSSRSAFSCCMCACALRLSDQKSSAKLSSSSLAICVDLLAKSKTHHSFVNALLQAFDLCYKFVHLCFFFFAFLSGVMNKWTVSRAVISTYPVLTETPLAKAQRVLVDGPAHLGSLDGSGALAGRLQDFWADALGLWVDQSF